MSANDPSLDEKQPLSNYQTPAVGGDFLVPANMNVQSTLGPGSPSPDGDRTPTPTNTAKTGKKQRAHHSFTPGGGMDEYFKEGEEKSKELDYGSSSKPSSTVKPPPKAGGPPRG
jgi:hypothetical protein